MHCREICSKYSVKRPLLKEIGRYEDGQKRCSSCVIYINWKGPNCPCCGHILRTKPRNKNGRNKLSNKIIFKKFQLKLNLSQDTINYSERLFDELMGKSPFKFQYLHLIIAISIFIASRFKGQQKSIKQISEAFQIKESDLELCCEMALDEIKETLVSTN
jgi:hypothetical protein